MAKAKPPADTTAASDPAPDVPTSALVRVPSSDEASTLAALADAGIELGGDDGLSEVALGDLRTPKQIFNLSRADGVQRITKDQFLNTVTRAVSDRLELVLLDMHKTHLYEVYDGNRNVKYCTSFDRVTGIWQAETGLPLGTERPCKGCPDQVWRTVQDAQSGKKRRMQPCCEVWNVAAFDMQAQEVVMLAFKKTSLGAIKTYVQTHHVNRLVVPGRRPSNIPLCVYRVDVSLEMDKSGNHAVPKFGQPSRLSTSDMRMMHETALGVRETFAQRLQAADESARHDVAADDGDTSFDTGAMDAQTAAERGREAFVE